MPELKAGPRGEEIQSSLTVSSSSNMCHSNGMKGILVSRDIRNAGFFQRPPVS